MVDGPGEAQDDFRGGKGAGLDRGRTSGKFWAPVAHASTPNRGQDSTGRLGAAANPLGSFPRLAKRGPYRSPGWETESANSIFGQKTLGRRAVSFRSRADSDLCSNNHESDCFFSECLKRPETLIKRTREWLGDEARKARESTAPKNPSEVRAVTRKRLLPRYHGRTSARTGYFYSITLQGSQVHL